MTSRELRAIRRKLDLSQAKLAKRLGIGLRNYSDYERGIREVPVVVALAVERLSIGDDHARLRRALIEAGRAAGAYLSDDVSNDFLMKVPEEIRLVLQKVRSAP